uniref:Uncharacterized protein n=1 Tax=Branchiostoma floridae TaxID=7739 RepID=C3YXY0_BRAFL|eukprot:XP_002598927.1 hypothetical protein BRAFLDRAFT_79858 [Branchiostoma floridae]
MQTALAAAEVQPLLKPTIVESPASPPYDCTDNYDFQNHGPMATHRADQVQGDPLCRPTSLWSKVRRSDVRCSLQGTPTFLTAAQYMIQKVQRTKRVEKQDQTSLPLPRFPRSCPCSPPEMERTIKSSKRFNLSPPVSARQYAKSSLNKLTWHSLSISSDEEEASCLASTERKEGEHEELRECINTESASKAKSDLERLV